MSQNRRRASSPGGEGSGMRFNPLIFSPHSLDEDFATNQARRISVNADVQPTADPAAPTSEVLAISVPAGLLSNAAAINALNDGNTSHRYSPTDDNPGSTLSAEFNFRSATVSAGGGRRFSLPDGEQLPRIHRPRSNSSLPEVFTSDPERGRLRHAACASETWRQSRADTQVAAARRQPSPEAVISATPTVATTLSSVPQNSIPRGQRVFRLVNAPKKRAISPDDSHEALKTSCVSKNTFAPHQVKPAPGRGDDGQAPTKAGTPALRDSNDKSPRDVEAIIDEEEAGSRERRRSSIAGLYQNATRRKAKGARSRGGEIAFEWTFYFVILCFAYFVLVGVPLWRGVCWWFWIVVDTKELVAAGCAIFVGIAAFYASGALLTCYEKDPPEIGPEELGAHIEKARRTALIIPCYKAEQLIGPTLECATKIFPSENIFIIANGNSPAPLDNTADVCRRYNVNHLWVPIGSKIVAQFVGVYAAEAFDYCLLIDDDCALPANFPIVSDRIQPGNKGGEIKCIGYTIKSVGQGGGKGTLCQQAQDLEYKLAGMQRQWAGLWGSAVFPHGAIALWDREFLIRCLQVHPGFTVSEDWYFGHVARLLGGRIQMCSSVLVETETPSALFKGSGARGGFGEMTVWRQRFYRWNFFFLWRWFDDLHFILFSWKLGRYAIGAKIYIFQEMYQTFLYVLTPFFIPIAIAVQPRFFFMLTGAVIGMYFLVVIIFNETILRRKKERVALKCICLYYIPYKTILRMVTVVSVYHALYKYARYFAKKHPKVVDDERAVKLICQMENVNVEDLEPPVEAKHQRIPLSPSFRRLRRRYSDRRRRGVAAKAPDCHPSATMTSPDPTDADGGLRQSQQEDSHTLSTRVSSSIRSSSAIRHALGAVADKGEGDDEEEAGSSSRPYPAESHRSITHAKELPKEDSPANAPYSHHTRNYSRKISRQSATSVLGMDDPFAGTHSLIPRPRQPNKLHKRPPHDYYSEHKRPSISNQDHNNVSEMPREPERALTPLHSTIGSKRPAPKWPLKDEQIVPSEGSPHTPVRRPHKSNLSPLNEWSTGPVFVAARKKAAAVIPDERTQSDDSGKP